MRRIVLAMILLSGAAVACRKKTSPVQAEPDAAIPAAIVAPSASPAPIAPPSADPAIDDCTKSTRPVTLTFEHPETDQCVRMLVTSGRDVVFVALDASLDQAARDREDWASSPHSARLETRLDQFAIDARSTGYLLLEGTWRHRGGFTTLTQSRLRSLPPDEAMRLVPNLMQRLEETERKAAAQETHNASGEPSVMHLGAFPTDEGVRTILSRASYDPHSQLAKEQLNTQLLPALHRAFDRDPRVIQARKNEIRAALVKGEELAKGLYEPWLAAYCTLLDEKCDAWFRELDGQLTAISAAGSRDLPHNPVTTRAIPFVIDWLSRRPTWDRGEQSIAALVAATVRARAPWLLVKRVESSSERPPSWPKSSANNADMRALLASEGWTILGEVGVAASDAHSRGSDGSRIALVNPSQREVVVTITQPSKKKNLMTVSVPAETVVHRRVAAEAEGVVPVGGSADVKLRVASGEHVGVVTYRFHRDSAPQ